MDQTFFQKGLWGLGRSPTTFRLLFQRPWGLRPQTPFIHLWRLAHARFAARPRGFAPNPSRGYAPLHPARGRVSPAGSAGSRQRPTGTRSPPGPLRLPSRQARCAGPWARICPARRGRGLQNLLRLLGCPVFHQENRKRPPLIILTKMPPRKGPWWGKA